MTVTRLTRLGAQDAALAAPVVGLDQTWRAQRVCRPEHAELFFDPDLEDAALAVCDSCPVTAECLAFTIATHSRHLGIDVVAGGMRREELRRLLRTKKVSA